MDVEERVVARIERLRKLRKEADELGFDVNSDAINSEIDLLEKLLVEE